MLTQSGKAKGRRLQQWTRDRILNVFKELTEDDVRSTSMGAGGVDVTLSQAAKNCFPFSIECKNVEKIQLWNSWSQCLENCEEGMQPLLIIKRNGCTPIAVMDAEYLINKLKEDKDEI